MKIFYWLFKNTNLILIGYLKIQISF
jgi:hypothetical protein